MIGFDLDFDPWARSLHALEDALDDELEKAVHEGAQDVAFTAKADHPYTDRTHRLTGSIRAYAPRGRFRRDTLQDEVIATAPYAARLERRPEYAFLEPALRRSEDRIEHYAHDALEAAVRRADLR